MTPLEIERAIEQHPKKIVPWRFMGCAAVCEDGVCLDFCVGTNPWDSESVFMVVRGGTTPQAIADAAWGFFQYYEGQERELVEGRVEWMPWFGHQLDSGTIAGLAGLDVELSEEAVELFNQLVTDCMRGHQESVDIDMLRAFVPPECFDALISAKTISETISYKTTCPIITIEQLGEQSWD